MYCAKCGTTRREADRFCGDCGADFVVPVGPRVDHAQLGHSQSTMLLEAGIWLVVLLQGWTVLAALEALRAAGTDLREFRRAADAGGLETLSLILGAAVGCGWLVWQYRVLKKARDVFGVSIGRSPAWGTWSWIVPIASFWVPQTSLREGVLASCPRSVAEDEVRAFRHAHRQWWLIWVGFGLATGLLSAVATWTNSTSLYVLALLSGVLVQALGGWWAIRVVRIGSDWQERRAAELLGARSWGFGR